MRLLAEVGDKTRIATALSAARFHDIAVVAAGTLGMMAANAPAALWERRRRRYAAALCARGGGCRLAAIGALRIGVALGLLAG